MKNKLSNFFNSDRKDENKDKVKRDSLIAELNKLKADDPVSFNQVSEKMFHKFMCKLIEEFDNRLYVNEAINEIAFELDVSPMTAKRYMGKHTTRRAQFYIEDKIVHCRKHNHQTSYKVKITKKE